MSSDGLFPDLPTTEPVAGPTMHPGDPRVARPDRNSLGWEMVDLDQLVATDHPVRLVVAFVAKLKLGPLYHAIKARAHGPGRDAIDPALLLALWLFATIEGVGSARELARLCERDLPYRWLCGGVGVNHHALSDFRVDHEQLLDQLLTDSVTALVADGLIQMERLAQDGVKVRASAGAASFRRRKTIARLRGQVEDRIAQLRRELDDEPGAAAQRRAQARARAAEEQAERLRRAQQRLSELEAAQAQRAKKDRIDPKTGREKEPRVSTTDPDARVMRMAAGAFRPAYNVQMGCDPDSLVVVDVGLEPQGADRSDRCWNGLTSATANGPRSIWRTQVSATATTSRQPMRGYAGSGTQQPSQAARGCGLCAATERRPGRLGVAAQYAGAERQTLV
jgi:transposase